MDSVTIKLSRPLETKSGRLEALTFKPATLGDALDVAEFESEEVRDAALFAKMCGLDLSDFRMILNGDFREVRLAAGPLTGRPEDAELSTLLRQLGFDQTKTDERPSTSSPGVSQDT